MKHILIDFGIPFRFTKTGLYNYNVAIAKYITKYQDKFKILYLKDVYFFSQIYGFIGKLLYIIWLNLFLPFYVKKYKIELIHFTNYLMPFIPLPVESIVTIHDLRSLNHEVRERKCITLYRIYRKIIILNSLKRATKIIALSKHTHNDIIKYYGKKYENKIEIIPLGIESCKEMKAQSFDDYYSNYGVIKYKYIIMPGPLAPRKNHSDAILMFFKHKDYFRKRKIKLVIMGSGEMEQNLRKLIMQLNLKEDIIMTGYIPKEHLFCLYRYAMAGLFLSSYEGFGLPILEMLLMKVITVMSDNSSIREASGGIGYFIKTHSIDEIFERVTYILEHKDEVNMLKEKGVIYASKHTWQLTIDKTVALYEELLSV